MKFKLIQMKKIFVAFHLTLFYCPNNHRKQEMVCEWAHSIIASGLLYRKTYPDAKPSGPVRSESLLLFKNVKQEDVCTCSTNEDAENYWHFYFTLLIFCKVRSHYFLVFKSYNSHKVWKVSDFYSLCNIFMEREK